MSGPPMTGTMSKARSGVLWQGSAYVLARLTLLLSTVVLARLLGPSEYGFISFGLVLVTTLNVVSDIGVSQALVYLDHDDKRVDVALAVGVLGSVVLTVLWIAASPLIAVWLHEPGSVLMLQVLGAVLVFTTIGQIPDAVLRKRLDFAKRMPGELARGLARGVIAIGLALAGFGAWSLVWAEIAGAIAYAVVCWVMVGHRLGPWRTWFDRREARTLLRFGVPTALNGGLATAVLNVDYLIVVSTLGSAALGGYFVGFRIPELVVISVFLVISQVTYPMYAAVNGQPERLRRGYILSTRLQTTYGFAAGAGIAVASPVLVPVLFGDQYAGSVHVMQAIAIYTVFRSLTVGAADLFKAVGRPELGMWLGVVRIVLLVPSLFVGTRWGITGVAVAQMIMALVFTLLSLQVVCRVLDIGFLRLLREFVPSLLVGIGSAAGAGIGVLLTGVTWWGCAVTVVCSIVLGLAVLAVVDRGTLRKVVMP